MGKNNSAQKKDKIAIYPGTFDPITLGHIDIIERAAAIFDKIIVVIGCNISKKNLFTQEERLIMAKKSLEHLQNIDVIIHNGLTVDIARRCNAIAMIRGIRAISDFDYEFQIALANRKIESEIHTVFMLPDEKYSYLSSSVVRELAKYGENVIAFVPPIVAEKLSAIKNDSF